MADPNKSASPMSVEEALKKLDVAQMQRKLEKGEVVLPKQKATDIDDLYTFKNIDKFIMGEITWAQLQGITMEEAYAIAEFGYGLYKEGKFHDALKIFEGLVICNPYDSYFHNMLGAVYQQLDMRDEALESYTHAIDFDQANLPAWVNRAELLLQNGDFEKALEDLNKTLGLDPDGKQPAGLRARALAIATTNALQALQKVMAGADRGVAASNAPKAAPTPKPMGKSASKSASKSKPKPMAKSDSKSSKSPKKSK